MAYNSYYPATYQPIYNPVQTPIYPQNYSGAMQQGTPQTAQTQTTNRWDWVQGETGAKSYLVAPNTTVLLLDSEGQKFYLKSADASGMPLPLRIFEYTETAVTPVSADFPRQAASNEEYATKAEIDALRRRVDEMIAKRPQAGKKKEDDGNE